MLQIFTVFFFDKCSHDTVRVAAAYFVFLEKKGAI